MANLATLTVTLTGAVSPLQAALAQAERSTSRALGAMQSSASGAAATMTRALGAGAQSVSVALSAVASSADRSGSALGGALRAGAHAAQSAISAVAHVAGGVAVGALRSLGRVAEYAAGQLVAMGAARAAGAVRQALGEYAEYERLGMSLQALVAREMLAQGQAQDMARAMEMAAGRAEELRGWIEQLAIRSPFDQQGVAVAFRTALAYGFTTQEAQRLTRVMIDFAAATGQSSEVMDRIALALGQIKARGKLAGQEILQLTNAGLDVRDALARSLGKSRQEIEALIEAGIDADTAISAIVQTLERDFGGAAERQANTFSGLLSTLKDVQIVLRRVLLAPAFRAAQPAVQRFVDTLQSPEVLARVSALGERIGALVARAAALGERIALGGAVTRAEGVLARVASAARRALDVLGEMLGLARGLIGGDVLRSAGALVARALATLRDAWQSAQAWLTDAVAAWHARGLVGLGAVIGQTVVGLLARAVDAMREAAPRVLAALGDLARGAAPEIGRVLLRAGEAALGALDTLAARAGDVMLRAVDALAAQAPALIERVRAVDWGGLLRRLLLGDASSPEEIVRVMLERAVVAATTLIGSLVAGPVGALGGGLIGHWLVNWPEARALLDQVSRYAVQTFEWTASHIRALAGAPIWAQIGQHAQAVFARVVELAQPFAERLSEFFGSISGKIADFFARNQERFAKIAEGISKIVADIAASPVWQTLYQIVYGAFDLILTGLERALDTALAALDVILAVLAGDYDQLGALLRRFAESALGGIAQIAWGAFRLIVHAVRDLLAHLARALVGWLADLLNRAATLPGVGDLFGAQLRGASAALLMLPTRIMSAELPARPELPQINITINAPATDARAIADEAVRALRVVHAVGG